ncbi:MAG: hypothetical protein QM736_02225 [Vicinamibacterales bacterium]
MKAALVIAHPGHELRVFGWAQQMHPTAMVLTRGDGHGGVSRLESTSRVLDAVGGVPGSIYGRFGDREIYDLILHRRLDVLLALRDELADAFVAGGFDLVACDAEEWYNPSHDVCHYIAVSAARVASQRTMRAVQLFDFPLIGLPDTCPDDLRSRAIRLELDDDVFGEKLENAARYPELKIEVDRALAINGAEAFRVECLRPVADVPATPPETPFYELYGERQVQAGHYSDVIRFNPHIRAVCDALQVAMQGV